MQIDNGLKMDAFSVFSDAFTMHSKHPQKRLINGFSCVGGIIICLKIGLFWAVFRGLCRWWCSCRTRSPSLVCLSSVVLLVRVGSVGVGGVGRWRCCSVSEDRRTRRRPRSDPLGLFGAARLGLAWCPDSLRSAVVGGGAPPYPARERGTGIPPPIPQKIKSPFSHSRKGEKNFQKRLTSI